MSTEAIDLILRGETIAGVRATMPEGAIDIEADLTVACDGRHSLVRERAGLEIEEIGAPMECVVVSRRQGPERKRARVRPGRSRQDDGDVRSRRLLAMRLCDRKGQYDAVKRGGLQALLDDVVRMAPILQSGISEVKSWDDVKLLTVAINRLKRWTRPGLLCIGDAAHAMSPVGGVGVQSRGSGRGRFRQYPGREAGAWLPARG